MAKSPPALLAWGSWILMFTSAIILLGGISASQKYCGAASANAVTISGGAGYFANVSCDKLYRYTWFITWYMIFMAIVVPIVLATGSVHRWRYGLIGLLLPLTYLLMNTAQAFFIQQSNLSTKVASSKTMLAGAIIGAIANYMLIILFGVRSEKAEVTEHFTDITSEAGKCIKIDTSSLASATNVSIQASPTCGQSTVIPSDKLGTCPDAQATLDAHNAARARYGAAPLLWSRTLANYAQTVSNTCRFAHSNGPYGENLAIGPGLSCKTSVDLWVNEEKQYPPGGTPGFSEATGHFTAVVWKNSVQVGCATRLCSGRNFVTCSYYQPGNVIGQFNTQVGRNGDKPECVAPGPGPVPVPVPPPAPAPTPVTPPPKPPTPPPVVTPPPPPPARQCCIFGRICFRC